VMAIMVWAPSGILGLRVQGQSGNAYGGDTHG